MIKSYLINRIVNEFRKPKKLTGMWIHEEVDVILMNKDAWEGLTPLPVMFDGHKYLGKLPDGAARIDNISFYSSIYSTLNIRKLI